MRKFLISAALAASALAVATPAAAQWYPQPQRQGAPYGQAYGYGYNNGYGQARFLQREINTIQQQIAMLDRYNRISNREARSLNYRALMLERQVHAAARNGLNPYERKMLGQNITRLGWAVRAEANEGRRWSRNGYDGRDNYYGRDRRYDRDYNRDHDRWHDRNDD